MDYKDLQKKLEDLELENYTLMEQLTEIDHLMRMVGFTNGLQTVKITTKEIYESGDQKSGKIDIETIELNDDE